MLNISEVNKIIERISRLLATTGYNSKADCYSIRVDGILKEINFRIIYPWTDFKTTNTIDSQLSEFDYFTYVDII